MKSFIVEGSVSRSDLEGVLRACDLDLFESLEYTVAGARLIYLHAQRVRLRYSAVFGVVLISGADSSKQRVDLYAIGDGRGIQTAIFEPREKLEALAVERLEGLLRQRSLVYRAPNSPLPSSGNAG